MNPASTSEPDTIRRRHRRRRRRRSRTLAAIAALTLTVGVSVGAAGLAAALVSHRQPAPRPLAVVYRGPAACPGCAEAVAALLRRSPLHFRVAYIGAHQARRLTASGLRGVALYAQPGGNGSLAAAWRSFAPSVPRTIRRYVRDGGHYLGFCMGAYLAGENPGFALLSPGDTNEYDRTPGASVTTAANAVIPVIWEGHPHYQFAQDPPYIIPSRVRGERVLARFTNGLVDALVRPYGRGAVGVVGTHPEADRSWFTRRLWREDRDGPDYRQGLQLVAALMRVALR